MSRINLRLVLGICLCLPSASVQSAAAEDLSRKEIYQRALHSTALVLAGNNSGSAWVVDVPQRLLITSHHVVGNLASVAILFPVYRDGKVIAEKTYYQGNGRRLPGRVIDSDPQRDLALIQLESLPPNTAALKLAADGASPGDALHSVGNPSASGAHWVYTSGSVRQVYRKKVTTTTGQTVEARMVETQAPINPGDSGGPVLNDQGELVGVTASYDLGVQLVSNCIEAGEVRDFLAAARQWLNPRTAADFRKRGAHYMAKGRNGQAIDDFTQVVRLEPKDATAYRSRGQVWRALGENDKAIADFVQTLRLNPKDALAWRERGFAFHHKGEYDQALADYDDCLRLDPTDAIAWNNRGFTYYHRQDWLRAIVNYDQAIRLRPKFDIALSNRGLAYYRKGDHDKALADIDLAIGAKADAGYFRVRGEINAARGDLDQALADYTKALEIFPKFAVAFKDRAATFNKKRLFDKAISDCSEALKLSPKYAPAFVERGRAFEGSGELDKAIADYTEAIRLDPKDAAAYLGRSKAYSKQGDADKAAADSETARKLNPPSSK